MPRAAAQLHGGQPDKRHVHGKDLAGRQIYRTGHRGMNQSAISAPVDFTRPGKAAKIDVALTARVTAADAAWPGRVPEVQVAKISTDAKVLPAGDGSS